MTGIEVLAAMVVPYLVRKLRRVGTRLDADVDQALDAGMDKLEHLVTDRLRDDPALAALREQAADGAETERTVRRVTDAVADAAEHDEAFAQKLQETVDELQQREAQLAGGGITSSGDHATNTTMTAHATGNARVYQAGRDQTINDR